MRRYASPNEYPNLTAWAIEFVRQINDAEAKGITSELVPEYITLAEYSSSFKLPIQGTLAFDLSDNYVMVATSSKWVRLLTADDLSDIDDRLTALEDAIGVYGGVQP